MASARQLSFEKASGRWRAWIDSDDRLPGPEEAKKLLELNGRWQPPPTAGGKAEGAGKVISLEYLLSTIEEARPDITCLWAPYLYQRDADNQAIQWQERERIVRWDDPPLYFWAEKGHEVLVPVAGYIPPRADLAHLLFVHEKDWTVDAYQYSLDRHWDVIYKQYEEGEITTRRCWYLANFAQWKCPERRLEFIKAAYDHSTILLDRYMSLILMAEHYADLGFGVEAFEHYGAAVAIRPELPDAYISAGTKAFQAEHYLEAVQWLEKGVTKSFSPESQVAPRHLAIRYPTLLSEAKLRLGREYLRIGMVTEGHGHLAGAADILDAVARSEAIGNDKIEAILRARRARNEINSCLATAKLFEVFEFLRSNDEGVVASKLIDAVPHLARNHPLATEMIRKSRKILRHVSDPEAYNDFYNNDFETGLIEMPIGELVYDTARPRVRWMVDYIKALKAEACPNDVIDVLDVGSCDGIVGVPLMEKVSGVRYTAADVNATALAACHRHIKEIGGECETILIKKIDDLVDAGVDADVVIWSEVIEHVADPLKELKNLRNLGPDLVLSTPDGAYDDGHPPEGNMNGGARDERGHVRALTVRDVYELLKKAGYRSEITVVGDETAFDPSIVAGASTVRRRDQHLAFVVPGALWDWNGRTLKRDGMGASEEMIVAIAELLTDQAHVDVYGPTPNRGDVLQDVGYWPRESLATHGRYRDERLKVIISRAPGYYATVDQELGYEAEKILWLQDTTYPDLSAEVAEKYEAIVVVSEWHKQHTHEAHGVPLEKMHVIYNALDQGHFQGIPVQRKRDHFIYASSPDRGVNRLLRLWPRVLEMYPDATLDIFYGWRGAAKLGGGISDSPWQQRYREHRSEFEKLRYQKGITIKGMVDHPTIALEFGRAGVWAYPTDFHETGCLTACKARAGGAVPVTSALAALNETAACPQAHLIDPMADDYEDRWLEGVRAAVEISDSEREKMMIEARSKCDILVAVAGWLKVLS